MYPKRWTRNTVTALSATLWLFALKVSQGALTGHAGSDSLGQASVAAAAAGAAREPRKPSDLMGNVCIGSWETSLVIMRMKSRRHTQWGEPSTRCEHRKDRWQTETVVTRAGGRGGRHLEVPHQALQPVAHRPQEESARGQRAAWRRAGRTQQRRALRGLCPGIMQARRSWGSDSGESLGS